MRIPIIMAAGLLLQSGPMQVELISASPQQLRYERSLLLPDSVSGRACAILDDDVFAHAASRSTDDLRIFRSDAAETEVEVPFALAESEAQPDEVAIARPSSVHVQGNTVDFDLAMPQRAYSTVVLGLGATNFDGVATVKGISRDAAAQTPLGSFPIFDHSTEQLGRSTALPLQEMRFPKLHVQLEMWRPSGAAFSGLPSSAVEGATVPPSREDQTLYTTVAQTTEMEQRSGHTIALLHVPAHVPVERIAFVVEGSDTDSFRRGVAVSARPDGARDSASVETVVGAISMVHLPRRAGQAAVFRSMEIDAALVATLRRGATLEVDVDNGSDRPLPIRLVQAQMRQRTACFHVEPGGTYMLRYGDATLPAPLYAADASNGGDVSSIVAKLGAERTNPDYIARVDARSYPGRHPELLWVLLVIAFAGMGATGMHIVRQMGRT